MNRVLCVEKPTLPNGIFIKKKSGNGDDDDEVNNIKNNQHLLDTSLHSFDPNKSSPPNDFFMKSFIRLKQY